MKRRRRFLRKYDIFPYDYFIINVENYILEIIVAGGTCVMRAVDDNNNRSRIYTFNVLRMTSGGSFH